MAITNGLATLEEVKRSLDLTDSVDDTLLELVIEAASRQIEQYTERIFTSSTATRVYTPQDNFNVEIDDLTSLTTLKTSTNLDGVFDQTVPWSFRSKNFQAFELGYGFCKMFVFRASVGKRPHFRGHFGSI